MIYEYSCLGCGHTVEVNFSIGKAPREVNCAKCFKSVAVKLLGKPSFTMNTQHKDRYGTPIWCPDGGYYDRALNRSFGSAKEKKEYMREKGVVMDGSSTPTKWSESAGDVANKDYRKAKQMQ